MRRQTKQALAKHANDKRIDHVYATRCSGVQISIFDLAKVSAVGHASIAAGADDTQLGDAIAAFVQTIRRN